MKKELAFVAMVAALSVAAVWPGFGGGSLAQGTPDHASAAADEAAVAPGIAARYDFGPRIIQVPQRDGPSDVEPRTQRHESSRSASGSKPKQAQPPRRKYHASAPSPSPAEKRRAVLSAAPPLDGPSPVRATPRWREPGK